MEKLKILVACEESQAVTKEFRALGHEAYSCDLYECSGGHPEWHYQKDVTDLLKEKWDLIIAFPPCTYLSSAQMGWYNIDKYGEKALKRIEDRKDAINFFMLFANCKCEKVVIENPVGSISTYWRKPDQIIQPWQFGDKAQKTTCLWLKGLPKLVHTDIVDKGDFIENKRKNGKTEKRPIWFGQSKVWNLTPDERRTMRSKTFPGIAKAMAQQWSEFILNGKPIELPSIKEQMTLF